MSLSDNILKVANYICEHKKKSVKYIGSDNWYIYDKVRCRWIRKVNMNDIILTAIRKLVEDGAIVEINRDNILAQLGGVGGLDIDTLRKIRESKKNAVTMEDQLNEHINRIAEKCQKGLYIKEFNKFLDRRPVVGFHNSMKVYDFETRECRDGKMKDMISITFPVTHACISCCNDTRAKTVSLIGKIMSDGAMKKLMGFLYRALSLEYDPELFVILNPPGILWTLIKDTLGSYYNARTDDIPHYTRLVMYSVSDVKDVEKCINKASDLEMHTIIKCDNYCPPEILDKKRTAKCKAFDSHVPVQSLIDQFLGLIISAGHQS